MSVLSEEPTSEQTSAVIPSQTETAKPFLNQFQKNVLFVSVVVLVVALIIIGANYVVQEQARAAAEQTRAAAEQARTAAQQAQEQAQEHERQLAEKKPEWRWFNSRQLRDLSVLGGVSAEEQARIDSAGDDLDRLQQVLLDLHQKRFEYWTEQSRLDVMWNRESDREKADSNAIAFRAAWQRIHDWKPVSFDDYVAGKVQPLLAK